MCLLICTWLASRIFRPYLVCFAAMAKRSTPHVPKYATEKTVPLSDKVTSSAASSSEDYNHVRAQVLYVTIGDDTRKLNAFFKPYTDILWNSIVPDNKINVICNCKFAF